MNPQARKVLQPSRALTRVQVPHRFTKGVGTKTKRELQPDGTIKKTPGRRGASEVEVAKSAESLALQMEAAVGLVNDAKAKGKSTNPAVKQLDNLAELVRRADIERKDPDGGVVVADIAAALLKLDMPAREQVLRRAGRPAFFEPLLQGDLPEPPAGGLKPGMTATEMRKVLADAAGKQMQRNDLPIEQRPSSFFIEPQRYTKSGNPTDPSDSWKNILPKDNMDVAARRGTYKQPDGTYVERGGSGGLTEEDLTDWGMKEVEASTKKAAANRLAGDQIAMARAIKTNQKEDAFLPQVVTRAGSSRAAVKKYIDENIGKLPKGVQFARLYTALRPNPDLSNKKVAEARKWVEGLPPETQRALFDAAAPAQPPPIDSTLTKGTSQRRGGTWDGGPKTNEIEKEVALRGRNPFQLHLEPLYTKTAPLRRGRTDLLREGVFDESVADDAKLRKTTLDPNATVDLDRLFPWWRARVPEMDARGRYRYPARLPSAEWLTGMIKGVFVVSDQDFMQRMAPLIQRSIEAAPPVPAKGSPAAAYASKVYLLGPEMEAHIQSLIGSQQAPPRVYGERKVPVERVSKPQRYLPGNEPGKKRAEDGIRNLKKKAADSEADIQRDVEERMKKYMGGPGTTDTSSIYRVPAASPIQGLLA